MVAITNRTCKSCGYIEPPTLHNGECFHCYGASMAAWKKKMAIRQDPAQFDITALIAVLLSAHWMHECTIVTDYVPLHSREGDRPACCVVWREPDGNPHWLRHSAGPLQGYFWDTYGDDFHRPELALLAISKAPPPPRIDFVIPTHGK